MKKKIFPIAITLIFLLLGILLTYASITSMVKKGKQSYAKTTATVIAAEVWYSDDGRLKASSTYEYYVDGERYVKKTKATDASSAKFEGETFTVKYYPEDPEKEYSGNSTMITVLGFGIAFTVVGGGLLIGTLKGKLN